MGITSIASVTVTETTVASKATGATLEIPVIPETVEVPGIPETMETPVTGEDTGVVSLTIHLHHPISITANKPHIYVNDVTFQKYPQLSPHASEDFIKVR